jgi:choline dehydrogenase-like flavoprotein
VFDTSPDASGNYVVRGVEFSVDGEKFVVSVTKEVIVSAGTAQTPQLLELSGTCLPT